MRKTLGLVLSLAFVFYVGDLLSSRHATQAQSTPAADNKAVCEIEDICLTAVICDEDTGELDADGDLVALTDQSGAKIKRKAKKRAAKKKATRKKATRKKATKKKAGRKAAAISFNEQRGDIITGVLSDEDLTMLLAELIDEGGFFELAVCGDGEVEPPEVCEPEGENPDTCIEGFCSTDCSACLVSGPD